MASLRISAGAPSLEGRVALVTGAGRGIGRGIAVALAAAGARVMAVSRTEPDLVSLQTEIGGAYCVASLADEAGCRRAFEETRAQLGAVGILVNNAGDAGAPDGPAWEVEPANWRLKLAVNLDAPFYLTRLVLPGMLAAGTGRIVNIASTAGLVAGRRHDDVRRLEARPRRPHPRGRDRCGQGRRDVQRDLPRLGANRPHRGHRRRSGPSAPRPTPQAASSRSPRSPSLVPTSRATRRPASVARPSA